MPHISAYSDDTGGDGLSGNSAVNIVLVEDTEDDDIAEQFSVLGWCSEDDSYSDEYQQKGVLLSESKETEGTGAASVRSSGHPDDRIASICKKLKEVRELQSQLDDTLNDLKDNAREMAENEQSLENRMLTAAGVGTVGIGGMMAASALAEQRADEAADRDMTAYMETMRCSYADGKSVKMGFEPIELPGGNDAKLMRYRSEYIALAKDLKERKESLGMKPGIESETILDKAEIGLYDDENVGITGGPNSSLYRAKMGSETDQAKIDEEKGKTDKKLKTGATLAVAGAVATVAANYALNHDKKNRSEEILAKRREIKSDYDKLTKELLDECNKTIQEHKDSLKNIPAEAFSDPKMQQYKKDVESAKTITTLEELTKSKFCL